MVMGKSRTKSMLISFSNAYGTNNGIYNLVSYLLSFMSRKVRHWATIQSTSFMRLGQKNLSSIMEMV